MPGTRLSTSAIPENCDAFALSIEIATDATTRHSLVTLEATSTQRKSEPNGLLCDGFGGRERNFSDASSWLLWPIDHDDENEEQNQEQDGASTAPCSSDAQAMGAAPYHGVTIEVNNHSINNQGVVMYHVDIKGPEGLLSTYTIRRRFRAFRNLYAEMRRLMEDYARQVDKERSFSMMSSVPLSPLSEVHLLNQQEFARVALPPLPQAGVWTYLKRHDVRLVEQRKKRFQEILCIVIRHPATRRSAVLDTFLSIAPSKIPPRGSSYVSLQDYSVPSVDQHRESMERRQRKLRVLEHRRQSEMQ